MRYTVGPNERCLFCGECPRTGAWGVPCPHAPDKLHWTPDQWAAVHAERLAAVGAALRRAAYELDETANRLDSLPARLLRRLLRHSVDLDPGLIRNEAERARDYLHMYNLLDV